MNERLFWVSLSWATFGLVVVDERIHEAPPIAKWSTGKSARQVLHYFQRRGALIKEIGGKRGTASTGVRTDAPDA
jgi:hypothetical protein